MSQIDLIILGYLQNGPKSAYEMVKEFDTWNLHYWLKISNPAIYKNVIKLSENGYLNSKTVREGEMPEKIVYTINERGIEYFNSLMEESSENIGLFYFDFNAFISNIERVPVEKRNELLKTFKQNISKANTFMNINYKKEHAKTCKPDSAFLLLDLYKDFHSLLENWSDKVIEHYEV